MRELQAALKQFCEERDWVKFHAPKNLVMALSVEVAELMEHFTWVPAEQSYHLPPGKRQEVADEVGDIMLYLVNLCSQLGIDPLQAAHEKLEKVKQKYPVDAARAMAARFPPAGDE